MPFNASAIARAPNQGSRNNQFQTTQTLMWHYPPRSMPAEKGLIVAPFSPTTPTTLPPIDASSSYLPSTPMGFPPKESKVRCGMSFMTSASAWAPDQDSNNNQCQATQYESLLARPYWPAPTQRELVTRHSPPFSPTFISHHLPSLPKPWPLMKSESRLDLSCNAAAKTLAPDQSSRNNRQTMYL
jgi:hypothetical protein